MLLGRFCHPVQPSCFQALCIAALSDCRIHLLNSACPSSLGCILYSSQSAALSEAVPIGLCERVQ